MEKLYIGNLNYITTEEMLSSFFQKFGKISSVKLMKDEESGRSRGFAFIEFEKKSAAEDAISVMSGRELDGRKIIVNYADERKSF